jgi:hypothetical protein
MFQTKDIAKLKTQSLCSITSFRKIHSRAGHRWQYNTAQYNTAGQATDGNITQRKCTSCCVTKATDAHSECVIPTAFPLQQWLRERASMLRYTYTACPIMPVKPFIKPSPPGVKFVRRSSIRRVCACLLGTFLSICWEL